MLTIYRRHRTTCPNAQDRYWKRCKCPMWAEGTVEGQYLRESLKTRSWERAEQLKKQREAGVVVEEKKPAAPPKPAITVEAAFAKYYETCEFRKLSGATLKKYRTVRKALLKFATDHGISDIKGFDQQRVRDFVRERSLGSLTTAKEIERVRTFFGFCLDNDWIIKNPARPVKPPKVKSLPRIPFSDDEVLKILAECETPYERAFIDVLRLSGLRIGDASLLRVSQLQENRLYLYTTKAGVPVSILLPPQVVSELKALKPIGGYFFLIGESTNPHTASNLWRRRIKRMCEAAKIVPDHPHRFRHTLAADLLSQGASVEDVAAILGNSPAIVQKHYSQWIKSRQDRLDSILESTWKKTKLVRVK